MSLIVSLRLRMHDGTLKAMETSNRPRPVKATITGVIALLFSQTACSDELLGWEEMDSPTRSQLDAVWGTSPDDVWAVGHDGVALHYDGSSWQQAATGTSRVLHAVWGVAPDQYWAGGSDGNLLKWDGSTWTPDPLFEQGETVNGIASISGTSSDDIWVSTNFDLFHWDGASWNMIATPDGENAEDVYAYVPGEVWATGESRKLLHRDGDGNWEIFEVEDVGGVHIWNDITGCSDTDLWAVSSALSAQSGADLAYHWDGSSWQMVSLYEDPQIAASSLEASWCSSTNDVWTVGIYATHHYDGTSWEHGRFPSNAMFAIWGAATGELWSVGSGGAIFYNPGD